jgi:holliday junction DNA helicase RuvA
MIGYLTGSVIYSDSTKAIVLTKSGIGYEVSTATPLVPNKEISLFISHIIRENAQDLYGFEDADGKKFFEMLLDVNGIGPKSAFSLVTHLGVEQIMTAITFENVDVLKSAPGVGKKSAEQIVLSLKDKVNKLETGMVSKKITKTETSLVKETLAACLGLGYRDADVLPLIKKFMADGTVNRPEEMMKLILKEINVR